MRDLRTLFAPKSIAIIGASRDPSKIGHVILRNFVEGDFPGRVYPINPKEDEILGLKAYKSVLEVEGEIEAAVIAIPAKFVPATLEECGKKGIKGITLISGGFKEVGNYELEEQLLEISKRYDLQLIGPNCLGIVDLRGKVDSIFIPTYKMGRPKPGGVSFITQSGAVGSCVLDLIARQGFGMNRFISYGNASVIDETDLIEYLVHDEKTKLIVMYLEGVKRGRAFFDMTKKFSGIKPIIILKAGTTEIGANAAKSHTGSLAGNYAAYEAVFKQNHLIEAKSIEELFTYAKIFDKQPLCTGENIAIITNGGGMGVLVADAVISNGLKLAELTPETKHKLKETMPPIVGASNPLDLVGDADASRFEKGLELMIADPNVDAVIVITLFQTVSLDSKVVDVIVKASGGKKPIINVALGGEYSEIQCRALEMSGVPSYSSPTNAAKSLSKLIEFSKNAVTRKSKNK